MNDGPTITERQALGNLLDSLKDTLDSTGRKEWCDYITEFFSDWEPIHNSNMDLGLYYRTLKRFPQNGKREIIRGVLLGWNEHHSFYTLYNCITKLIYLKVCDTVEYFFLQQFYNFLSHFSEICESLEQIEVTQARLKEYTIRFYHKDVNPGERYPNVYGIIDFEMSKINETPRLAIVPWKGLLSAWKQIDESEVLDADNVEDFISDIYPLLSKEFAKTHCPWINSQWECNCHKDVYERGLVFVMHSLQYEDYNGGF